MILGIPKENFDGENRVAVIPDNISKIIDLKIEVIVESTAGQGANISDEDYVRAGAKIIQDHNNVFKDSDVILKVRPPTIDEVNLLNESKAIISFLQPHENVDIIKNYINKKVTSFSMNLMPRITRAQSMDALSSMSSIAGYKAVLLAANELPKFFPLMMTAAGTISPAKVFVLGAGVAGLQAIATAKRLGAVVDAYDVRPVVKEQIESLGARFVELSIATADSQTKGGYAKEQSEDFYKKQQELLGEIVAKSDVVITTALIPGRKAPILVTEDAVKKMRKGSVVVDLAAEGGGNCEVTEAGKKTIKHGVVIIGFTNLPSGLSVHACQMYSRNITTFLRHLIKDGQLNFDMSDEITKGAMVTNNGELVNESLKNIISLETNV